MSKRDSEQPLYFAVQLTPEHAPAVAKALIMQGYLEVADGLLHAFDRGYGIRMYVYLDPPSRSARLQEKLAKFSMEKAE